MALLRDDDNDGRLVNKTELRHGKKARPCNSLYILSGDAGTVEGRCEGERYNRSSVIEALVRLCWTLQGKGRVANKSIQSLAFFNVHYAAIGNNIILVCMMHGTIRRQAALSALTLQQRVTIKDPTYSHAVKRAVYI